MMRMKKRMMERKRIRRRKMTDRKMTRRRGGGIRRRRRRRGGGDGQRSDLQMIDEPRANTAGSLGQPEVRNTVKGPMIYKRGT
jgi:hypothetical protein